MHNRQLETETQLKEMQVNTNQLGILWLGQSGYVFKDSSGDYLAADPYLTETISQGYPPYIHSRLVPPGLSPEANIPYRAVLLTHAHQDHLDPNTVVQLYLAGHSFVGPSEVLKRLNSLGVSDENLTLAKGTLQLGSYRVTPCKAVHSCETCGYIIQSGQITVYLSADTCLYAEVAAVGKQYDLDLAFLCINGQAGNMDCQSAAYAARLLSPRVAIPNHYGMYADSTAEPDKFAAHLHRQASQVFAVQLEPGVPFVYGKDGQTDIGIQDH